MEITKRVADKLGLKPADVSKEINYYWVDMDMMFTHCCGYGTTVEHFCSFFIYTAGVYGQAKDLDRLIRKTLRYVVVLKKLQVRGKVIALNELIAQYMTRIILMDYSVKEYEQFVLPKYPWKYKVTNKERYAQLIKGLEQLFGVPLVKFPITINNPVQEMYVRHLRKIGILQNPVVSSLKTYRGNYKGRDKVVEDKEVQ